ncbi:hypothetical protein L1987_53963 [Smallanthus sonchifolius]|uniref:Uncharacterized protein n=1 Tax=Smallanthus sonchifolius TaxID=185202 RepID=A0ACB9E5Q8_9ASTR|nr:hypothetical protein L1987_53963 [Smallanthus sonchifolius]
MFLKFSVPVIVIRIECTYSMHQENIYFLISFGLVSLLPSHKISPSTPFQTGHPSSFRDLQRDSCERRCHKSPAGAHWRQWHHKFL